MYEHYYQDSSLEDGLKVEPHLHSYNVNWVNKTAQSITQQVPIHMSSYEDHVWCDVLDIDVVHILLCRPWLYDLDVTNLGRSTLMSLNLTEENNAKTCQTQVKCGEELGESHQHGQ